MVLSTGQASHEAPSQSLRRSLRPKQGCLPQTVGMSAQQVGQDPRPILRAAYECFRTGGPPQRILDAAGSDETGHDRFYALLVTHLLGCMAECLDSKP